MEIIADLLLVSGALGASFYCFMLGRKLNRFNSLEKGVGGAVAVLSAQVDDLEKIIGSAQKTASDSANTLTDLTLRAEEISRQLELQMASLHDIPKKNDISFKRETPKEPKPQTLNSAEPMFIRHSDNGAKH